MKVLKILLAVLVVALVAVVLLAPIGPLPGIFIGGNDAVVPSSWGDTRDVDEVRLQVGDGLMPRVVIIWVIQVDGALHVVGARDGGWTSMIGRGGPVRLRIDDETYDLRAEAVVTGWQPVLEAYVEKYRADYPEIIAGFPAIEEAEESVAVFRLIPRVPRGTSDLGASI